MGAPRPLCLLSTSSPAASLRAVLLASLALSPFAAGQSEPPSWDELNARPTPPWFEEAKFGIFIHWGVYSVPAYCDTSTYSEWYQHWYDTNSHGGLVREFHDTHYGADFAYREFADEFRAELFDPSEWAEVFARAGARYVVLTSKHHDGYCLWPNAEASEVRGYDWNSLSTGPRRDLVGELSTAVRARGLDMGLYYSFMEWHNPLYDTDKEAYVERVMIPQIRELIDRYQPTIFWPDGEWDHPDELWRSREMLSWIRANHANADRLVVNDRWGRALRGNVGDYYTTEYGNVGGGSDSLRPDKPFEECRGIGHSFAFNRAEGYDVYASRTDCVRLLIDLVAAGGNLLLDIGPTADGRIPLIMQDRLFAIGRWLERNGESIYGASRSPFRSSPWGNATVRGETLFLHVYDWPADFRLDVPGLANRVELARICGDAERRALPVERGEGGGITIDLAGRLPGEHATVVALELDGPPRVDARILPDEEGRLRLLASAAEVSGGSLRVETGKGPDETEASPNLGYWTDGTSRARWRMAVEPGRRYRMTGRVGLAPGQEGGVLTLTVGTTRRDIRLEAATGHWQSYVDLDFGAWTAEGDTAALSLQAKKIPKTALMNLRWVVLEPLPD